MTVSIIVAFDENYLIGRSDGSLPWNIPEDLKLFKLRTLGHPIICGRRTWESLPHKPLADRLNIVVSTTLKEIPYKGVVLVPDILQSLQLIRAYGEYDNQEIFIIGGRQLYQTSLQANIVDKLYVSKIYGTHDGDIFFPQNSIDKYAIQRIEKHTRFDFIELAR
jgi:dihydrofolate reductase